MVHPINQKQSDVFIRTRINPIFKPLMTDIIMAQPHSVVSSCEDDHF